MRAKVFFPKTADRHNKISRRTISKGDLESAGLKKEFAYGLLVLVFSLTRSILWDHTALVLFVSAASAMLTVLSGGFTQRAAICGEQDAAKANTLHTHTPEQAERYRQNTHTTCLCRLKTFRCAGKNTIRNTRSVIPN